MYVSVQEIFSPSKCIFTRIANTTPFLALVLLMDRKDFNQLGIGIDDLIDAYVQTVLSVIAIDKLCQRLMPNDCFDFELFRALNPDDALLAEILT